MDKDFLLMNHGSVITLAPQTEAADDWVKEHIPDDAPWFGGAVGIEPRYIGPIIEGIQDAGLSIDGSGA